MIPSSPSFLFRRLSSTIGNPSSLPSKLSSFSFFRTQHFQCLLLHRFSSSSPTTATIPSLLLPLPLPSPPIEKKPTTHFMAEDYLVKTCGLSPQDATKVSRYLSSLRSPQKIDSLMGFLKNYGFTNTQIRNIIFDCPKCSLLDLDKNLAPKFDSLEGLGFSGPDLIDLIHFNPRILTHNFHSSILPKIEFWLGVVLRGGGSRDQLSKLFSSNYNFLARDIQKSAVPNLALLRGYCGVSEKRISIVLRQNPRFIMQKKEKLIEAVDLIEKELGLSRSSGMFLRVLFSLTTVSKATLEAKRKLMRSFGWSDAEFLSSLLKAPTLLSKSSENLARKMGFFLKEAGCKPSDIAFCPVLLLVSLDRTLVPRHRLIKALKSRGLICKEPKISSMMISSEKVFREKYVVPYKETISELYDNYMAARGSTEKKESSLSFS